MEQSNLGGVGTSRKVIGFIILLAFTAMSIMSGFAFYTIATAILVTTGVIGMSLMIVGIAKDVIAIAKNVIK